jgi:hypothetical protein
MHTIVITLIHLCLWVFLSVMPIGADESLTQNTLITINSTTRIITAYNLATDTHTPLFTCPEACYDPAVDDVGRIGFVTDSGFAIYDPANDEYRAIPADFGTYGYKGASFRHDLRYVAYEARFDMDMRLMLTDLEFGTTTDLYGGGVGKPSWTGDGDAILSSDGNTLWHIPINGDDVTAIVLERPAMYTDLFTPFADGWLYRGMDEGGYYLFSTDDTDTTQIASAPAILGYSASESSQKIALSTFDPRNGVYQLLIVGGLVLDVGTAYMPSTGEIGGRNVLRPYTISQRDTVIFDERREIATIALSPDGHYLAWIEENPDMGFGFYDVWIADLSASEITPMRVAEQITTPAERPSGVAWMD